MIYRSLGGTGLTVSIIGLGCGHLGRRTTGDDPVSVLNRALDLGITFFDTADVYMGGESERVLGEVLRSHRGRVVIATKVGYRPALPASLLAPVRRLRWWAVRRGGLAGRTATRAGQLARRRDFSPRYIARAVEASLGRLRTDCIDLLQLHSPPAAAFERDGALETLGRLKDQGKVRWYGLAFATCEDAQQVLRHGDAVSTLQIPLALGSSGAAADVVAWARQRGIGVIGNQPLGKGALLRAGVSPSDALRFVTTLPGVATTLVGTTRRAHLDEDVAALGAGVEPASQAR